MKRRKPKGASWLERTLARMRASLSAVSDGAVDALATINRTPAAEVDNEVERWSPLRYVHHQRDLMSSNRKVRERAELGRAEWQRALHALEVNDNEWYQRYMLEVDKHIDAGELVTILPPELQAEASERARVSGPAITHAAINAPLYGIEVQEWTRARAEAEAAERAKADERAAESAARYAERMQHFQHRMGIATPEEIDRVEREMYGAQESTES